MRQRPFLSIRFLWLLLLPALAYSSEPQSGKPAFGFTLKTFKGEPVSLDGLKGKIVLIDFWAQWCAPCKIELPLLDQLQKQIGKKDLVVLAVNIDQKLNQTRIFLEKNAIQHLTLLWDEKQEVVKQYDVSTMPTSFLIDHNGIIRHIHSGFEKKDIAKYELEIRKLIEEMNSQTASTRKPSHAKN
jgi:peroxiredoxin